ncbi:MAG: SAM-dependent chlorinase/fluorinase [Solirubrobacteraceae bacterium]
MSAAGGAAVVTFLSDYGRQDEFVGVCHAVIARRAPSARIIDLGHGIARHDVRAGALALRAALPYAPVGVHLAVVDPGVGSQRRALALAVGAEGATMVGPDNGLLTLAAQSLGGVVEAVDIGDSPECLRPISATFHGRDVFAPVAAALADGAALRTLGEPIAADDLVMLSLPQARCEQGALVAHVLSTDFYGNVSLDASSELAAAAGLHAGTTVGVEVAAGSAKAPLRRTFSDAAPGELLAYIDARGHLALAVNGGSAARELALGVDDELVLRAR